MRTPHISISSRLLRVAVLLACLSCAPNTWAARPMITDDARIVDAQACQLETWVKRINGGQEFWALPACNPTGNLELTVGGTRQHSQDGNLSATVLQGKSLWKPLQTDSWGAGLVVGVQRRPNGAGMEGRVNDLYTYVPITWSMRDDRWFAHVNLGIAQDHAAGRSHRTWGLASEAQMTERAWLITEVFGQTTPGQSFAQAGLRYWLLPNRVQIDTTFGQRLSAGPADRSISIGLRLLTPALW